MMKKSILLHICCGVCGSGVIERLRDEGFNVMGFFYNPNIYPEEEYKRRLEVTRQVSKILDFKLIEGEYEKDKWFKLTENLKNEPEGGKRCSVCFRMRLEKTCKKSLELNIPYFTTTLSISPHKNVLIINKIGSDLGKENFMERDFKKRDGTKLAMEFSKKYNLYRQNYCGCVYSMYG
ncbi:MAG: epoxyqueuosine reductase QueH [bacterium]